jgi:hypothetical protein
MRRSRSVKFLHVPKNGSVSFQLAATNVEGDAMTYTFGTAGHGLLTGTAPNLTYTPTTDYVGSDAFTFQPSASGGSGSGTVTFAVGKPQVHLLLIGMSNEHEKMRRLGSVLHTLEEDPACAPARTCSTSQLPR